MMKARSRWRCGGARVIWAAPSGEIAFRDVGCDEGGAGLDGMALGGTFSIDRGSQLEEEGKSEGDKGIFDRVDGDGDGIPES